MTPDEIARLPYRPCVGIVLVNADGTIFAGQRLDSEVAAWQMPQGGIDPGETTQDAALRELHEETGITADLVSIEAQTANSLTYELPPDLIPKLWGGKYRGQAQHWVLMRFNGQNGDVDIATDHAEFSAWRWISADDLIASIVPFKHEVYVRVLDEFKEHLT